MALFALYFLYSPDLFENNNLCIFLYFCSRQKKVTIPTKVHITNSKAIVSGEDPYLVDTIADKYLPHLSLDNKNGYGGTASLQLVTLREGDKSVTLPSLSVEQNYSQMLTELVMNI